MPATCMLIGEKPGERESHTGRPFVGPAGAYLDVCLTAANIDRKSIYVTNLVKEFTGYSKPTRAEIDRDHEELVSEILCCAPEVIGLVGGWAIENVLFREKAEIERIHGCPFRMPSLFGDELPCEGGWVIVPILHPANAVHSSESMPHILNDFLVLGQLLDGEIGIPEDDPYVGKEDYRVVNAKSLAKILRCKL